MALPSYNYAALQPQGNPGLRGIIPSIQSGIGLFYSPQMLAQELEQRKLQNALSKVNLDYSPEMTAAELAYKQAQTPHINAQTQNIHANTGLTNLHSQFYPEEARARIGAQNANTAMTNEQLRILPLKTALDALSRSKTNSRWGPTFQLAKMLDKMDRSERALWVGANQEDYNQMLANLAQAAREEQNAPKDKGEEVVNNLLGKYFPGLEFNPTPSEAQAMVDAKIATPGDNFNQLISQSGNMSPVPWLAHQNNQMLSENPSERKPFEVSPEVTEQMKLAANLSANKTLSTAATLRQLEGGIQIAEFFNDPGVQERALDAAEYAGALGRGKAFADAWSQKNPKKFTNALAFEHSDMVLLPNRIKQLDQMGSTDKQREELHGFYSRMMNNLYSNPDQFITGFNNLGKSVDAILQGVNKSALPLGGKGREIPEFKPISLPSSLKSTSIMVVAPNGQRLNIPPDKIDNFLKKYPSYKRLK